MKPFHHLITISALLAAAPAAAQEAAPDQDPPTVAVVATGGTIAMTPDPETGAPVPALSGEDLVAAVPALAELADIRVVEFSNVPSPYMGPDRWPDLARAVDEVLADPDVAGAVITHGTDTIEETAYFLDLTLESDKPVVLVGALRSAEEADSDGPRNIANAVRQILDEDAAGKGVTVTMNQTIHPARAVRKTHTSNVGAFGSGEYGPIGYVDADDVVFYREPLRRQQMPLPEALPRVDLVAMYTGADGSYVRQAVDTGAEGIVIQGFGWGNVNEPMHEAIEYAIGEGVPVVITSRVPEGRVQPHYGFTGGGATLEELGAVFGDNLRPAKARILLMLALGQTTDQEELQAYFNP
jgi:L-asparaginase